MKNAVKTQMMQSPLKTEMTGEDGLPLASQSCDASACFRGPPSPDMRQKKSGDAVFGNKRTSVLVICPDVISVIFDFLMDNLRYKQWIYILEDVSFWGA